MPEKITSINELKISGKLVIKYFVDTWFSHFQFTDNLNGKEIQDSFILPFHAFYCMCVYTNVYSLHTYSFFGIDRKNMLLVHAKNESMTAIIDKHYKH